MNARLHTVLTVFVLLLAMTVPATWAQRRVTPVTTAATMTQAVNETAGDSTRILAKRRAQSTTFIDDKGNKMYLDTITGEEWTDSVPPARSIPKMEYPLLHAISAGINLWDPVMRLTGQKYGLTDIWVELSLHNRYKPIFEFGLGMADDTPEGMNFTYHSGVAPYFKLGANYNFLFNSDPAYSIYVGLRYGFTHFSYHVTDVTVNSPYWGEEAHFNLPRQTASAGWLEVVFGLRVKIWGPISAGWSFRYAAMMHLSRPQYGRPSYVPGFGSRTSNIGGSFSVSYTFTFPNKEPLPDVVTEGESLISTDNTYTEP